MVRPPGQRGAKCRRKQYWRHWRRRGATADRVSDKAVETNESIIKWRLAHNDSFVLRFLALLLQFVLLYVNFYFTASRPYLK